MLRDRVQPLEVQDQDRPAAVQVGPELIHHQFFNIFTHELRQCSLVEINLAVSAAGQMDAGRVVQAVTRIPGLMVAETVTDWR